jgi:hypothetical protein
LVTAMPAGASHLRHCEVEDIGELVVQVGRGTR